MFLALAEVAFRTQLTFRVQLWALLLSGFLDIVVRNSVWSAVYGDTQTVNGVTLAQMITYAILGGAVLTSWDATQIVRYVGAQIKSGESPAIFCAGCIIRWRFLPNRSAAASMICC